MHRKKFEKRLFLGFFARRFFAVHAAMSRAIKRAHRGDGPTAIECVAKRWRGHFEGDPQNYRDKAELTTPTPISFIPSVQSVSTSII